MKVVRIHDPNRRPASWTAMIEPGQFVAFSRDIDSGAPCGGDGRGFADHAEATCVILDALAEAEAFCAAAVEAAPSVRFDVFDAEGRAKPALMTVVHPSRAKTLDTNPRAQRRRRAIAWILIATGIPLIAYAYWMHREQDIILPAFVGINMIIAGGRLLWFNLGLRETEREREARLAGLRDK